jgi:predicted acyl esterase
MLAIILKRGAYQRWDGAELFTCIYSPRIFQKYYIMQDSMIVPRMYGSIQRYLTNETMMKGNIVVYQDVRGRYMVMVCMIICVVLYKSKKIRKILMTSDTYDTIDWLVKM